MPLTQQALSCSGNSKFVVKGVARNMVSYRKPNFWCAPIRQNIVNLVKMYTNYILIRRNNQCMKIYYRNYNHKAKQNSGKLLP